MSSDIDELKRQAAEAAVTAVASGMVLGLGSGSTAAHVVRAVGRLLADGRLRDVITVPTSQETAELARSCAIPLTTLQEHPTVDLTIDGADEIDPQLNLIKGLGGALLHEKIVAVASRRMIVVADARKQVAHLGERSPLPIEVIPFALRPVTDFITGLGARVTLRRTADGAPFRTDENNVILDCHFGRIRQPQQLAAALKARPGVVEHGLFLGIATTAVVATADGVVKQTKQ